MENARLAPPNPLAFDRRKNPHEREATPWKEENPETSSTLPAN